MNLTTIYNVFIRDFRKQKKRITLTLIALGWGTISIMVMLAFGEGLQRQLTKNKRGLGEGIGILWGGQTQIPYKGMGKGRPIRFTSEDIDFIKERIPDICRISGEMHRWGARVRYQDNVISGHITGIGPEFEHMRAHIPERGGRMINALDMELKRRVLFLGDEMKRDLFGEEEAVGQTVFVDEVPFMVVGVMKEKMQMSNYAGSDENKASIPLSTFETIYGRRYLGNTVYQAHDLDRMPYIEEQLYQVLGAKYQFDPEDEAALSIWDVVAGTREMTNILFGIKIFLGIIGGLTLIIAGVGVANIMYVSIKERTREIGIKMAVGARRSYILAQFLIEALIITFGGGIGGILISYIMTEGFSRIPIESDVLDFMGRPILSPEIGIAVVIILGLVGILAGLFPAMKAASVSPVESLRYE
ncbi:MAG: ABC transporter permease [FCB group bacterium]|nr:ABC transporter permease [FCB group bacterium]